MNKKNLLQKNLALAIQNHQKGNFQEAENFYTKILKTDPNHFECNTFLGTLFLQIKNFETAIELLKKATEIRPNEVEPYYNLGYAFTELGELKEAIFYSQKAIQIKPDHAEAHYNLGNVFKLLEEFEKAEESYKTTIKINPNNARAHNNLGNVYKQLGEYKNALNSYKKAIEIQPDHGNAYFNLGNIYKDLGEFKKAINSYEKLLKYYPQHLETTYNLSELNKKILDSKLKSKVIEIINNKNSSQKNIAYGNFLLAKYELKDKNFQNEFNYLLKAHLSWFQSENKKFEKGVIYWLNDIPKLKELFSSYKYKGEKNNKIKPIFIVGVPRCGSTLIEKVIGSGAKHIPMGEETGIFSNYIKNHMNENEMKIDNMQNIKEKIIEKYKQRGLLQKKFDNVFTDKSLNNFFYVSIIKEIFPKAKIINCKRNVLASVMSILKNNLGQIAWAHSLENIFKYFDIYNEAINYFDKKYPNFIYQLNYEKFVSDSKVESKKLMKFCNLDWNKECLEFYKRKDIVSQTTSNIQIRKSIYKDSIKKYLPYRKFLSQYGSKYNWYK